MKALVFLFNFLFILVACSSSVLLSGCKKRISPTEISVADSIRHYYPIVAGETLDMSFIVKNTGSEPFLIDDIQPSCGCIVTSEYVKVIPSQDSVILRFSFNSNKNTGYVRHCIRLYGNVRPRGMATLIFDVNFPEEALNRETAIFLPLGDTATLFTVSAEEDHSYKRLLCLS